MMRFIILLLVMLFAYGCATPKQCVEWDSRPSLVTFPVAGVLVTKQIYPCVREQ